jgi:hypothetical protein
MQPPNPSPPLWPRQQAHSPSRPGLWQRMRTPAMVGVGGGALLIVCMLCVVVSAVVRASATGGTGSIGQAGGVVATPTATILAATAMPTDVSFPTPSVPIITPTNTPRAHPTNTPCATGPCNPWGYNFIPTGGTKIMAPPTAFCSYFACIGSPPSYTSFWTGQGYVVECKDTKFSKSGGTPGSCMQHGGDFRTLFAH